MSSKVTGAPAGKYTAHGPDGKFVRREPVPNPEPKPDGSPESKPADPPVSKSEPAGRPSLPRRLLTGSLGEIVRGR
jgi:hypothetical protein